MSDLANTLALLKNHLRYEGLGPARYDLFVTSLRIQLTSTPKSLATLLQKAELPLIQALAADPWLLQNVTSLLLQVAVAEFPDLAVEVDPATATIRLSRTLTFSSQDR
jgi:hypothetical protein